MTLTTKEELTFNEMVAYFKENAGEVIKEFFKTGQPLSTIIKHKANSVASFIYKRQSISEGLIVGYYADGQPVLLDIVGNHVAIQGKTNSGKSFGAKVLVEAANNCDDVNVLIYDKRKRANVFDAWSANLSVISQDDDDMLNSLKSLYELIMARGSHMISKYGTDIWTPGMDLNYLVVVLEEASYLGSIKGAPKVIADIMKIARSFGVSIVYSTQQFSVNELGKDHGNVIRQQMEIGMIYKSTKDIAAFLIEDWPADNKPQMLEQGMFYTNADWTRLGYQAKTFWLTESKNKVADADALLAWWIDKEKEKVHTVQFPREPELSEMYKAFMEEGESE
jgi:hypothetical protein